MLKVLREGDKYSEPCALLLGGFDGFHAGHETLLVEAKKTGLPVGLTSITGGKAGSELFTPKEREVIFARAGFAFVREIEFTEALKNTSAEEFLKQLLESVSAREIFCGEDFRFGRGREGTSVRLKELAPCPVSVLPLLTEWGEKVSASHIKDYLKEGCMGRVNCLLPYGYFMQGAVERGRGVGHTLGFPTLNLSIAPEKLLPKDGVYGGYAETPRGRFPSIINIGARPTFGVEERKVEAYLKGFSGDLYGETVRIYPTQFLRPIFQFSSKEELITQLQKDIERI